MIEIWTFRLRSGVVESTFRDADKRFQTGFSYQRPGLVRSTTARSADGAWLILRVWQSVDAADQARSAMATSPLASGLVALIDESTSTVEYFSGLD